MPAIKANTKSHENMDDSNINETSAELRAGAGLDYATFRENLEFTGETAPGDSDYRPHSLVKVNASERKVWINSPSLHMGWSWGKAGFAHRGANWAYSELEVGPSGRPEYDSGGPDGVRDYTYWVTIEDSDD